MSSMLAQHGLGCHFYGSHDETKLIFFWAESVQRRRLGRSGISVTDICLGTMTFGSQCDQQQSHAILDYGWEAGIDFFDAAEMYPVPPLAETFGLTEEILGNWLQTKPREQVIIATKITGRGTRMVFPTGARRTYRPGPLADRAGCA